MLKLKATPAKAKSHKTERYSRGVPQSFVDRNLMAVNPLKEQFEPTVQEAVRQRFRMGGGC